MYAIVEINGQQFKAEAGQKLFVHHIEGAENGSTVEFEKVLLVDKDGNVSATPVPAPTITNSDWFEKDGIYYYTKPVAPTGQTSNLLDGNPIKQPEGAPDGYHLEVTVLAESIQAAPSKAVPDSWGVRVDNNGYLTQPTTTP